MDNLINLLLISNTEKEFEIFSPSLLEEAQKISSNIVRVNFTTFQGRGFIFDRQTTPNFTYYEYGSGRSTADIPKPSNFELELMEIDEGKNRDGLFDKAEFVLSTFLKYDLLKDGYDKPYGASTSFALNSSKNQINLALIYVPHARSYILTTIRDEDDHPNVERKGMGNVIITLGDDNVDIVQHLDTYGHKLIYAMFCFIFSPSETPLSTGETFERRKLYFPLTELIKTSKTRFIKSAISKPDFDKLKMKPKPQTVNIFRS